MTGPPAPRPADPTLSGQPGPKPARDQAFSPGQFLASRYELRRRLGEGGMGEAWQAFDLKLRVEVALKSLHREREVQRGLELGECVHDSALGGSGGLAVTGDREGIVRVGMISEGEPHLLVGYEGPVTSVAVSPDRHWVATTGQDNTLRLWPMPDLSQSPLHTLPQAELLAKLRSLTNLRFVRDPESPNGYRIDLGPFPGWQTIPTW